MAAVHAGEMWSGEVCGTAAAAWISSGAAGSPGWVLAMAAMSQGVCVSRVPLGERFRGGLLSLLPELWRDRASGRTSPSSGPARGACIACIQAKTGDVGMVCNVS